MSSRSAVEGDRVRQRRRMALGRVALGVLATLAAPSCLGPRDITIAPRKAAEEVVQRTPPPSLSTGRLPTLATPRRYELALVIDPAKDRFTGDVVIDVDISEPTRFIVLHGRALNVLRAEATVEGRTLPATVTARPSAVGGTDPEELVLDFSRELDPGVARLHLSYSAMLSDGLTGAFRVRDGDDWYVFTQLEPMEARRAFPSFDEPGHKTPFDLKVTVPRGNLVVANMPEASRSSSDDGRRETFTFDSSPPLPTYLVAFAVGPFDVKAIEGSAPPIRVVTTRGKTAQARGLLELTPKMIGALTTYFDIGFPYPKLDLVAIPEFGAGAMENAGLITFREDLVLMDPASASPRARRRKASVLAHELAHHWFGNLVTMAWWDDLWLNEGVATFFESKVVAAVRPEIDVHGDHLAARTEAMRLDALDSSRPIRRPVLNANDAEAAFDALVYDKGARVVGMLEGWLGERAFRDGLRRHLRAHEHGSATAADLFAALSAASGQDVARVASSFLDRPGVPLVHASLRCEGTPRVGLRQSRYRLGPTTAAEEPPWVIPVCIDFEGRTAPLCTLLDQLEAEVELPVTRCPGWAYPNAAERGYYRSSLPPGGFRALARARGVDARQRFGILDNAWALLEQGALEVDVILDLLEAMRRDRDRVVVERIVGVLRDLDATVVTPESRPGFARFVGAQLGPIARELGWEPRADEPEDRALMRRAVIEGMALYGSDRGVMIEAERRTTAFLGGGLPRDAEMTTVALRAAARGADAARWKDLHEALARAGAPVQRSALLTALASVGDPVLLKRSLDLALTGALRRQEAVALIASAAERPASVPVVVDWLESRMTEVRAKIPPVLAVRLVDAVERVCDPEQRARVERFLPGGLEGVDGADRRIEQALERGERCIALRARAAPAVAKRFAR